MSDEFPESVPQVEDFGEEISYRRWARAKYSEISKMLNPCNEQGEVDPLRLNHCLTQFGGNFAWAITIQEIESNQLNIMQTERDEWFKGRWEAATNSIMAERGGTGRAPSADAVRARITLMSEGEVEARQKAIDGQRSRVDLLKGFVKVLDKQANILQTLSSNMRSELFFAGGIPIGRDLTGDEKTAAAKSVLRKAMKGQDPDSY